MKLTWSWRTYRLRNLARDSKGAVLIEAAFAIAILVTLLAGIVTYALWFMSAHSLQQAANEGARASLAGLDATERDAMVERSIQRGLLQATMVDPDEVEVRTSVNGSFFTVELSYDASSNKIFGASLVPMPDDVISRSATIELQSY